MPGCTVLTGNTVYGTAGGDIVEHAAPRGSVAPIQRAAEEEIRAINPRAPHPQLGEPRRVRKTKGNCDETRAPWMDTWVYRRA